MNIQAHNKDNEPVQIHPDPEQLYLYHRQQLSAMLDGELAPDEARFMLRRLQHDAELASCWERWQVCGDVLRGRADDLLPVNFSQRVMHAIQAPDSNIPASASAAIARRTMNRWRWSGGAALAASLVLVAWVVVRNPVPEPVPAAATVDTEIAHPLQATSDHALAVAEPPSPPLPNPVTTVPATPHPQAVSAIASEDTPAPAVQPPANDLLAPTRQIPVIPSRPWPRPLLPETGTGTLRAVVGYGGEAGSTPTQTVPPTDAFWPRRPESSVPQQSPPPGQTPLNR